MRYPIPGNGELLDTDVGGHVEFSLGYDTVGENYTMRITTSCRFSYICPSSALNYSFPRTLSLW
jgi:hypothetical protein